MKIAALLLALMAFNTYAFEQGQIGQLPLTTLHDHTHPSDPPELTSIVTVYIQNNCYTDVFVATKYQTEDYLWETKNLRQIRPGQVVLMATILNNLYYLHAQTYDGRIRWTGEHQIDFGGIYYPSALVVIPKYEAERFTWTTTLNCN